MADINTYIYSLPNEGDMAWEYNPFHNYQTDVDLYEKDGFIIPKGKAINPKNGEILNYKNGNWVDKQGDVIKDIYNEETYGVTLYAKAGSLLDLDSSQLKFDLNHPVDIEIQPSYDGSVNLILNDDKNIPRLINSRFSVREKNTYEIVDRIGENDTNIYGSSSFDKDTSLYFLYESNPIISYQGFIKGVLPVGLYCFYLTYCDADENESDYIAETGLIPVFIGSDENPESMDGGIKNQQSNKGIRLKISNLDSSYNYLKIYYVRYFADYQQNRVFECKKIYRKYPINSGTIYLQITGNEDAEDMDANILNITRFNPQSILTQAQCKNMLFFGNIVKNMDNYRELTDLALRITPRVIKEDLKQVSNVYDTRDGIGYYSSKNIYNKTGYFDLEYYRFGVVFIYLNGTLSNVYNTLGGELNLDSTINYKPEHIYNEITSGPNEPVIALSRKYIQVDDYGWIRNSSEFFESNSELNSRGVCKINYGITGNEQILGIKFDIPAEVILYLKEELNIRGLFFVRQKCVPNILALCYLMPMDKVLEAPVILSNGDYYAESFLSQPTTYNYVKKKGRQVPEGERYLYNTYSKRRYKFLQKDGKSSIDENAYAAICPDFLLNQPYYSLIFNGSKFRLEKLSSSTDTNKTNSDLKNQGGRFYRVDDGCYLSNSNLTQSVLICTVTEAVPTVALQDKVYRTEIGKAEEVFRFRYVEIDNGTYDAGLKVKNQYEKGYSITEVVDEASNLIRGIYSPYLAIYSTNKLETNCLYNIYLDTITSLRLEYQNRMDSSEPFYAISDRYNFSQILSDGLGNKSLVCWRGDCYINTFTYRLNRNFNDPSLPNNDVIIESDTWRKNYTISDQSKWNDINRSDVNAVQLGLWITLKVRSAMNYALRSEDHSYVSEEALMGAPRSFFPKSYLLYRGENKLPESYLYNDAYRASLGFKCYFTLQDINYLKNVFSNRILYSAISIQDSFKNNYRYSLSTYFRDYSAEYGGITKLVEMGDGLLVVFEHAIGFATIDETILLAKDGSPVFINTDNVLPQQLQIISSTIGTQWTESVVKSEAGYVYGVDTVAKKIWRVNRASLLEILSDFKVNKFLIDNITLGERELLPFVGLKNVKTHYNNNKKDVMFTFYDDVYKDEEKVWNLCFNELMLGGNQNSGFTTFYSWVPSYSENIDTQYFSFNRNTSKLMSLLSLSNYAISKNTGVLLDTPILNRILVDNKPEYSGTRIIYKHPTYGIMDGITFKIIKDHWGNGELFDIDGSTLTVKPECYEELDRRINEQGVILLYIEPQFNSEEISESYKKYGVSEKFPVESIALSSSNFIYSKDNDSNHAISNDFYIHGRSGIIDIKENIYPCFWYGEQHPFEFEFVVNDNIAYQKIFSNLLIIGNKATPESFHFEIEGDNYDWSEDKRNMYFRQEATKELYLNLGSNILFNRNYVDVATSKYNFNPLENYRNRKDDYIEKANMIVGTENYDGLVQNPKSTIFPLYYNRIDTYNDIYHIYQLISKEAMDYENLSGSEIVWNRDLNQFNVIIHIKNSPIDVVGRMRGNSHYKEGKWNIQIPSIVYVQKNESIWNTNNWTTPDESSDEFDYNVPPLILNWIPTDISKEIIGTADLPTSYNNLGLISLDNWIGRKETRIRDKWIKIRVRYSGKELAIIQALVTLYNISYA